RPVECCRRQLRIYIVDAIVIAATQDDDESCSTDTGRGSWMLLAGLMTLLGAALCVVGLRRRDV
ncbi:MAG: hypothetical protein KDB29_06150, partial [Planctomycetes bacterium]|nr:hypothetical protein [Planctomycetota bacterium]